MMDIETAIECISQAEIFSEDSAAIDIAVKAMEKQIPQNASKTNAFDDLGAITTGYGCPKCKSEVSALFDNYCSNCGQRLNWNHSGRMKIE